MKVCGVLGNCSTNLFRIISPGERGDSTHKRWLTSCISGKKKPAGDYMAGLFHPICYFLRVYKFSAINTIQALFGYWNCPCCLSQ